MLSVASASGSLHSGRAPRATPPRPPQASAGASVSGVRARAPLSSFSRAASAHGGGVAGRAARLASGTAAVMTAPTLPVTYGDVTLIALGKVRPATRRALRVLDAHTSHGPCCASCCSVWWAAGCETRY